LQFGSFIEDETMQKKNRILLFTGNGKGKTTAALGMVLRALGHGMRVAVFQFVKNDETTGEILALKAFPKATLVQLGRGFVPDKTSPAFEEHCQSARKGLKDAAVALASGRWDVIVLDEINFAVAKALVSEADVIEAIQTTAPDTTVVLTGRGATEGLQDLADTVTEMREIKHGFSIGWKATEGVEY
jgi:cob(I)alamin adenosyltransferase